MEHSCTVFAFTNLHLEIKKGWSANKEINNILISLIELLINKARPQ